MISICKWKKCGIIKKMDEKELSELQKKGFMGKEETKAIELKKIMDDWRTAISSEEKAIKNGDRGKKKPQECFVEDGFFPGYFSEINKNKILFIGRESRYIKKNYVQQSLEDRCFSSNWWRRIFYITYGIQHEGRIPFSKVEDYRTIIDEMEESQHYGFAVMNISKYSNFSCEGGKSNFELINQFLENSGNRLLEFFNRELKLLEPDCIITSNLWDGNINRINDLFPESNFESWNVYDNGKAAYGRYKNENINSMLIDLYHFAKPGSDRDYYYNPVMEILFPKK